jgi:hypothetical protein
MKKHKLFFLMLLLCVTSVYWIRCSICTITIENNTTKIIDSIRFTLRSENEYTFLLKNVNPKKNISKTIVENELKLGHYFFISSVIFSKDSTYAGPEYATDIVYSGGKYRFIVNEEKVILKLDE